jgi:hypothetical protein
MRLIKWKKNGNRFKPEIILKRIDSIRTVTPDGKVSFTGFELEYCLPALHSMLDFPSAATEADTSTLVWSALAKVNNELTAESFLNALNEELTSRLSTREQTYYLLTSISLESCDLPKKLEIHGAEIKFLPGDYPAKFNSHNELIRKHRVPVPSAPTSYCYVLIKTKAKSHTSAVHKALRALDLIRAIWCSRGNPQLQIAFGNSATSPINVIRLGGTHTLHLADGTPATDAVWFEPNFKEASIFRMGDSGIVKYSLNALSKLATNAYKDKLISSLIRYVRALDESDPNTAFVRLWGALEMLVLPGQADKYEKLVQRCAFLFDETEFHRQLLEHLREYRNTNVHAGEESEKARTHCYQLQIYFVALIRFHLGNAKFFQSLEEANLFLDFPPNEKELIRRSQLMNKAIRYRKPSSTNKENPP